MAHADGWIELYELLDSGKAATPKLVELCKSGRTHATRETMLHWYAIEGEPRVVQRLIDLGFDLDEVDSGGTSPIMSAAKLERWNMVQVLRAAGANLKGVDTIGESYRSIVSAADQNLPADLQGDKYKLEDLLSEEGPETQQATFLYLTRSGLPESSPGRDLNRESWAEYACSHSSIDDDWLEDQVTFRDRDQPDCHGLCDFCELGDTWGPTPGLNISTPTVRGRRVVYEIAQHFGARVLWTFECAPEPRRPVD